MVLIVMIMIIVYLALKAFQKEVMEIELFNKKKQQMCGRPCSQQWNSKI